MAKDYVLVNGVRVSVVAFLPLVRRLAYRLARRLPPQVDVNDLISAGCEGLMDALNKFDPARAERFEQYAEYRIRGAMLDSLRALDPLSRETRASSTDLTEAVEKLSQRLGRPPTEEELLDELGWSEATYDAHRHTFANAAALSLDELLDNTDSGIASGEDRDAQDEMADLLDGLEQAGLLDRALRCLPPRHEQVLRLHYFEGLTLKTIGEQHLGGVTESRVCQLEAEGLQALRPIITDLRAGKAALHEPRPGTALATVSTDDPLLHELAATAAALDALLDDVPRPSEIPRGRNKAS